MKSKGWLILIVVAVVVLILLPRDAGPYLFMGAIVFLLLPIVFPPCGVIVLAVAAVLGLTFYGSQTRK